VKLANPVNTDYRPEMITELSREFFTEPEFIRTILGAEEPPYTLSYLPKQGSREAYNCSALFNNPSWTYDALGNKLSFPSMDISSISLGTCLSLVEMRS